jgi:hypothetical protein
MIYAVAMSSVESGKQQSASCLHESRLLLTGFHRAKPVTEMERSGIEVHCGIERSKLEACHGAERSKIESCHGAEQSKIESRRKP